MHIISQGNIGDGWRHLQTHTWDGIMMPGTFTPCTGFRDGEQMPCSSSKISSLRWVDCQVRLMDRFNRGRKGVCTKQLIQNLVDHKHPANDPSIRRPPLAMVTRKSCWDSHTSSLCHHSRGPRGCLHAPPTSGHVFQRWRHFLRVMLKVLFSASRIKWNIADLTGNLGFPGGSLIKNPPANARDTGLIRESGRSPGEGNGNPFQCSCLGNPMDRGAWRATVHGVAKESNMTEWLNSNSLKTAQHLRTYYKGRILCPITKVRDGGKCLGRQEGVGRCGADGLQGACYTGITFTV